LKRLREGSVEKVPGGKAATADGLRMAAGDSDTADETNKRGGTCLKAVVTRSKEGGCVTLTS